MATYYVSWDVGNDANNGLGPDASHASNKPWKTVAKALGAAGISSGDIVYIAPGTQRETVTVAMTSPVAETKIIGDSLNTKGFKDGSGVLLAPNFSRISAWTTDDKTAPASTTLLTITAKNFLTFEDLWLIGTKATTTVHCVNTAASTNWTFRRCIITMADSANTAANCIQASPTYQVVINGLIDNCILWCGSAARAIQITATAGGSGDWDYAVTIRNSILFSRTSNAATVSANKSGASAGVGGGLIIENCSIFGGVSIITAGSATFPLEIYNSVVFSLTGVAAGDIVENYNLITSTTPRTNCNTGANSQTDYLTLLEFGQSRAMGFLPRIMNSPIPDSPLLGFGTDGAVSLLTDFLGRIRPSGSAKWGSVLKACGAMECHDIGIKNTADAEVGSCVQITGPGDHEFIVPVDSVSTVLSAKVKYDGSYGGTDYPQLELVASPDLGITAQTLTATVAASGAYETLTFASITSSSKSWVKIRFINRSTAAAGKAFLDTFNVS